MSAQLRSKKFLAIAGALAGALVVLAGGWLLLVKPAKSDEKDLRAQIAATQSEIIKRQADLARPTVKLKLRAADLYRLTKAMPDGTDMPGIILDISRLARSNNLVFRSITPSGASTGTGYTVQPLGVVVQGRFANISGFLGDLRRLVTVRKGTLDARGHLFSVDQVDLGEPGSGTTFPQVQATITLNSFSYNPAAAAAAQAGSADGTEGSSSSSTPTETTTPPTSTAVAAAGATP